MIFVDYTMTNTKNFSFAIIVAYVPTTQFSMDSNLLYIGHSNPKNPNRKIRDANLKKIGYPNLLPG
jgi:hypothetical protein